MAVYYVAVMEIFSMLINNVLVSYLWIAFLFFYGITLSIFSARLLKGSNKERFSAIEVVYTISALVGFFPVFEPLRSIYVQESNRALSKGADCKNFRP